MLYHGAQAGAFDLKSVVMETLTSMRRAGQFEYIKDKIVLIGLGASYYLADF